MSVRGLAIFEVLPLDNIFHETTCEVPGQGTKEEDKDGGDEIAINAEWQRVRQQSVEPSSGHHDVSIEKALILGGDVNIEKGG